MRDFTASDSSGRTKFSVKILRIRSRPSAAAASSSVAQYMPSRYSSTKVGTPKPCFICAVRSLRTIFPGNAATIFSSNASF